MTNAGRLIETTAGSIELVYGERRGSMDDLMDRITDIMRDMGGGDRDFYDDFVSSVFSEITKTHRLVKLDGGPHGTYSRYTNGRCRCDLCREANRERGRRYRKEVKERENEP